MLIRVKDNEVGNYSAQFDIMLLFLCLFLLGDNLRKPYLNGKYTEL